MGSAAVHAWILLSIPSQGASINDVLWRAAAINHSEPTDAELHSSLQWLRTAGLVADEGDRIVPTPSGRRIVTESWKDESMMATWDAITACLVPLTSMPNGKPGDHPLTDVLTHGLPVFTERVDELLRDVARLYERQAWRALHDIVDKYDPRNEAHVDALEAELHAVRERLERSP